MGLFQSVLEKANLWATSEGGSTFAASPVERLLGSTVAPVRLPEPSAELNASLEELWTELTLGDAGKGGRAGQAVFVSHWSEPAGATTLTLALGVKGAAMDPDLTFCLVDFDLVKRGLTGRLGLGDCMGVHEVANHDVALEPTLVATDRGNVAVLPAGAPLENAGHPVRREHARGLLRMLAEQFDFVLVDMPSIKESPGSLGWVVPEGKALLVVPSGRIKCESVERAVATLRRSGAEVAGIVLNRQVYPVPRWLYRWT